jgi:glutathione synthase/RimK-type ligase-like ATP-grasp enzyme
VDCHEPNIVAELRDASALLWHWAHTSPTDLLMARSVIMAAERIGLEVFPSTATCWHFDDKIAQKYLLEAAAAPLARTWVLYDHQHALEFIDKADLPLVFKLRRGAGSVNVRLVRTRRRARSLAAVAFGKGFLPAAGVATDMRSRLARARTRPDLAAMLLRLPRTIERALAARRDVSRERGYLYLQEYFADNEYDTRVTVIGARAFAFTRNVRPGDFRASGSGSIDYGLERIDSRCLRVAFDVTRSIGAQSMAFDFARDNGGDPRILEVSFAYQAEAIHNCPGHWDESLAWHPGHMWPQDAILDDLLQRLGVRRRRGFVTSPEVR